MTSKRVPDENELSDAEAMAMWREATPVELEQFRVVVTSAPNVVRQHSGDRSGITLHAALNLWYFSDSRTAYEGAPETPRSA